MMTAEEMNGYKEKMMDELFQGREPLGLFFMKSKTYNVFSRFRRSGHHPENHDTKG